jgi:hypothetical protein
MGQILVIRLFLISHNGKQLLGMHFIILESRLQLLFPFDHFRPGIIQQAVAQAVNTGDKLS